MSEYKVSISDYANKVVVSFMLEEVDPNDKNNTGKYFVDNFLNKPTTLTQEIVMKIIAASKSTDTMITNSFYTNMVGYEAVMKVDLNGKLFCDALLMENNLERENLEQLIRAFYSNAFVTINVEEFEDD